MVKKEEIQQARRSIERLFADQCEQGEQTRKLGNPAQAACGQFLGPEALQIPQQGLYGTAAAIRVLSKSDNPGDQALVNRLVGFIQDRLGLGTPSVLIPLDEDADNVIKLSEVLYALSFVPAATSQTEAAKRAIGEQLMGGIITGRGWSFYLAPGTSQDVDPIPTAYAIRALSSCGYDVPGPRRYLSEMINNLTTREVRANSDIAVGVLCLFVLTFSRRESDTISDKELRSAFKRIWYRLERLMEYDIEQNVEYPGIGASAHNQYVRIPWQLYLLALAAALAEYRTFNSVTAQRKMESILKEVSNSGFLYPHSGKHLSSRTNAILFDVLEIIEQEMKSSLAYDIALRLDQLRRALGSRIVRGLLGAIALTVIILSIATAVADPAFGLDQLAPEFLGALATSLAVSLLAMVLRKS